MLFRCRGEPRRERSFCSATPKPPKSHMQDVCSAGIPRVSSRACVSLTGWQMAPKSLVKHKTCILPNCHCLSMLAQLSCILTDATRLLVSNFYVTFRLHSAPGFLVVFSERFRNELQPQKGLHTHCPINYAHCDELQTCFLYPDLSITALYWHFLSGVPGSTVL